MTLGRVPTVRVGRSRISGLGVFAGRRFQSGETVLLLDDSRVVDDEHPLDSSVVPASLFDLPVPEKRRLRPLLDGWFAAEHADRLRTLDREPFADEPAPIHTADGEPP